MRAPRPRSLAKYASAARSAMTPVPSGVGGAYVARDRARRVAAAGEVLGEHEGVGLAPRLEPLAGELVAERRVRGGERRVRRLLHERVAEGVLEVTGETRLALPGHDLLV